MSKEFDVADALSLDKLALDYEWLRQTYLVNQATNLLADITFKRDRAKAKLAYESAKLANYIRSEPDEYNIKGTVTDGKVREIVTTDYKIYELEQTLHEWEAELVAANGVRRALEHKKAALEELTRLFLSGYWATPYISKEDRDKYKENDKYDQGDVLSENTRLQNRANKGSDEYGEE